MKKNNKIEKSTILKNLLYISTGILLLIIGLKLYDSNRIKKQKKKLWEKEIAQAYKQMNKGNNSSLIDFDNDLKSYFSKLRKKIPQYADSMTNLSSQFGYMFNKFTDIFRKKRNEIALKKTMNKFYKFFPDNQEFSIHILYKYSIAIYKIKRNYNILSEKILMTINRDKELFKKTNNKEFKFDKDIFKKDSIKIAEKLTELSLNSFLISEFGLGIILHGATRLATLAIPKFPNPWVIGVQLVALIGGGWYINKRTEKKINKDMNIIINKWEAQFLSSEVLINMRKKLENLSHFAKYNAKEIFFEESS